MILMTQAILYTFYASFWIAGFTIGLSVGVWFGQRMKKKEIYIFNDQT